MLPDAHRRDGSVQGDEVRTHLHDYPVCDACERGDHDDCIEWLKEVDAIANDFLCGCTDESHWQEEDAER